MKNRLEKVLIQIIRHLGVEDITPVVERPADLSHGDYTTNVAMVLAKRLKSRPIEIAEEIKSKIADHRLQITANKLDTSTDQSGQKISVSAKQNSLLQDIERIEVLPPGFINFYLSASSLSKTILQVLNEKKGFGTRKSKQIADSSSQLGTDKSQNSTIEGQKLRTANSKLSTRIMVEFAHPNTHKAFHIGHVRNISTGESLVRLLESQGIEVIRANYQGDVGMHIAKCMYGILQSQKSKVKSQNFIEENKNKPINERVELLGKVYAEGSKAYEENPQAKEKIHDYNYLVYAAAQRFQEEKGIPPSSTNYLSFVHGRADELEEVYQLWKETRQWSLDYFESIYKRLGSHFDRYYFESECLAGVDYARDAVKKGVLKESDGAIIFDGKPYGIDTRVFVNSLGLPTYEGKELALARMETSEFGKPDKIIHVVGPEQASFFKITFKAEELLGIQKDQQFHLAYGWVRLKHGKMSSRLGNVVLGEDLINEAKKAIIVILGRNEVTTPESEKKMDSGQARYRDAARMTKYTDQQKRIIAEKAAVAAIKYSFLKVSVYSEIAFDMEEAINIQGDSGPYLLYTYARCKSVLRKAHESGIMNHESWKNPHNSAFSIQYSSNNEELLVMRLLRQFPELVSEAAANYAPSLLCKYLYDLASAYNTFYNKHSILGATEKMPNAKLPMPNEHTTDNQQLTTSFRLALTQATAQVLHNGLYLLGIETVERM